MPRSAIERDWSQGQYITSVTAGSGSWGVVMSSRAGYDGQDYRAGPKWPADFIWAERAEEAYVTEIAYRDGTWLVVTSSGSGFRAQRWFWASSSSPLETMREVRSDGYHITDVAVGGGRWFVMGSRAPSFGDQVYTASSSLPGQFISENWNRGYEITEWYHGDGTWVVVMTRLASRLYQRRFVGLNVIEDAWRDGLQVLDIAYRGGSYWVVATENLGEAMGFPPPSGGVLKSRVTSSSTRSASFHVDLFVVGSDSELLRLDDTDFSIDDGELGSTGTHLDYTLTGVTRYRQRSLGPYSAMFLIDQSGSITGTDPTDARLEASRVFMRSLSGGDEAGLMAFASGGRLPHDPITIWFDGNGNRFSRNPSAFDGALASLADKEGGLTPLWDAT